MSSANSVSDLERAEHSSSVLAKRVSTVNTAGSQVNPATEETLAGEFAVKVTTSGTTTYVAKAAIGSSQSSAVWQAKKIDESSGVVITWADSGNYSQVATDLTALTYS